jgi:hypothetical protein
MEHFQTDFSRHLFLRKARLAAFLIVMGFLVLWARTFYGSMKAYDQGEIYFNQSEYVRAVTFFDRAIRWYAPLNPYVHRSAERLWQIGLEAEKRGNTRLALIAARTIQQGFYATRSFYVPGRRWIERCDDRIEKLVGHPQADLAENDRVASPDMLWTLVLEFGFLGWIGSVMGFIAFALKRDEQLRISTSRGVWWGSTTLICFALWVLGMMKA